MSYARTIWLKDQTELSADNMNHIELGIEDLDNKSINNVEFIEIGQLGNTISKTIRVDAASRIIIFAIGSAATRTAIYSIYSSNDAVLYCFNIAGDGAAISFEITSDTITFSSTASAGCNLYALALKGNARLI